MKDGYNTDALRKSVRVHLHHELFGHGHFGWRPARADDFTIEHMAKSSPPFIEGETTYRRAVHMPPLLMQKHIPVEAYVDACFDYLRERMGPDIPLVVQNMSSRILAVETNEKGYAWLREHLNVMSAGDETTNVVPLHARRL